MIGRRLIAATKPLWLRIAGYWYPRGGIPIDVFWQSGALQFVISVVGVLVFTGLTAWDAQRLKQMAVALPDGRVGAYAVVGALSLYLDFINLFFFLLRLTGGRRD